MLEANSQETSLLKNFVRILRKPILQKNIQGLIISNDGTSDLVSFTPSAGWE